MSTTASSRPDRDDEATVIRWIPLVVPLLALLRMLAMYVIASARSGFWEGSRPNSLYG